MEEVTEKLLSDIELNLMGSTPAIHSIGYRAYHHIFSLNSEIERLKEMIDEHNKIFSGTMYEVTENIANKKPHPDR